MSAVPSVVLVVSNGTIEVRRIPLNWIRKDVNYTEALEVWSPDGHAGPLLWCDHASWLEASVAGGGYQAVGATRATAVSLGAFTAGQRKSLSLRLKVPLAFDLRYEPVLLRIGLGEA